MKKFKTIFLILISLLIPNFSYAYEKLDFFDSFHIYTPYVYIVQDDTDIDTAKILILFHDCENLENSEEKKNSKKNEDKNNNSDTEQDNDNNDEIVIYDFATESAKWEVKAEREYFFIMGFDFFEGYESFSNKEQLDKINERVLMEIDRIKNTCNTKEIKVYVAGSQLGGDIALLFNLLYDNYDGALCMNISKPTKDIMKQLNQCENKSFYFFHCEKNKSMSKSKINSLAKKLTKKGATVETVLYEKDSLPAEAYFDAINKIK